MDRKLWDPLEIILCGPPEDQNPPAKKAEQSARANGPTPPREGSSRQATAASGGASAKVDTADAISVLAPALPKRTPLPAEIVVPLVEKCYASGEAKAISVGIRATEMHMLSSKFLEEVSSFCYILSLLCSNLMGLAGVATTQGYENRGFRKDGKVAACSPSQS